MSRLKKYNIKEACFACAAPYQIAEAIGIVKELKLEADLYIFATFPDHMQVAEKLRKYQIFSHVYAVDPQKTGKHTRARALQNFLMPGYRVSKFMPRDIAYNYYYSTSRSSLRASQMKVLWDRNPSMKRVMFEDGLGTYSNRGGLLRTTKLRSIAERLLGWRLERPEAMIFMSFMPKLIKLPEPFDTCPVEQMPRLEMSEENHRLIRDIFSIDESALIKERRIIFDLPRRGNSYIDWVTNSELETLDACYGMVKQYLGDDLICKPHPKSTQKTKVDIKMYTHQGIPMELLYEEMDDLDNLVLISLGSTALFAPKIIFDREPNVICLYKIIKNDRFSNNYNPIYEKFRNEYRNKEKVSAPDTPEELEKVLKNICGMKSVQENGD